MLATERPPAPAPPLQLWRCPRCGQPLMRVYLTPGAVVEVRCPKCRETHTRQGAGSAVT